jgi:signal peptidase I
LLALAAAAACSDDETGTSHLVEGAGMDPTLENGENVTVQPYGAGSAPEFGDVIVFQNPVNPELESVKRVIGLPGDTIEIREGTVSRNGTVLDEPYADGPTNCETPECRWVVSDGHTGPALVYCPRDCHFVLGDNRENSSDSRMGWFVPGENIIGYVPQ